MFKRHKRAFVPKEEVISTNLETVHMVVIFSFKKWYTSSLKNKTLCLLIFYVMLCNLLTYRMISLMQLLN